MGFQVRPPRPTEAEHFRRLGYEAFGMPAQPPDPATDPARIDRPGWHPFGIYDDTDLLVGRAVDRDFDSWFGGRLVPTCGVAGVTVAAEYRGRRLLDPLFTALLGSARRRGAVISALHPTAPRIYRRFGYEIVGEFRTARLPSWSLGQIRPDPEITMRRATPADVAGIRTVYDNWAAGQNGPLSRRGPSFTQTEEDYLAEFTGVSVAVDRTGTVCGYTSWDRGTDWGPEATLEVIDLLADRPGAYRSLLAAVGGHASVVGRVSFETSGLDLIRTFLPTMQWDIVEMTPYMLSILDVPGALEARGYGTAVRADVEFELCGVGSPVADGLPDLAGRYRLQVADGRARCVRCVRHVDGSDAAGATDEVVIFTPAGLAQAYAGVQSVRSLRSVGLITGSSHDDGSIDSVFGGFPFQIRDHF